jgi:hypothetical protein
MIESQEITGRTPVPLRKKLNPIWWFGKDLEQTLAEAAWYMPDAPQWKRRLFWEFRNPLQNFRAVVIGVGDRNYKVTGKAPVLAVQRDDLDPPETGWQWCVIRLGLLLLPFVSYSGPRLVCYAGWQPSGFFGFKFNVSAVSTRNGSQSPRSLCAQIKLRELT